MSTYFIYWEILDNSGHVIARSNTIIDETEMTPRTIYEGARKDVAEHWSVDESSVCAVQFNKV